MSFIRFFLFITLSLLLTGCDHDERLQVKDLTVNSRTDPRGIDTDPVFGWQLSSPENGIFQSHYRLVIADSEESLLEEKYIWDSGKKASGKSQAIRTDGFSMKRFEEYYWQVQVWEEKDIPVWSEPAYFSAGILNSSDWQAEWISERPHEVSHRREYMPTFGQKEAKNPGDTSAILMRREVVLEDKTERAVAFISGLGYYELFINGERVGDHLLDPVFSDYQRTVYYLTYDVAGMLRQGKNVLGVRLGNGFYNLPSMDLFMMDQANWKTPNKLLFQMEMEMSDGSRQVVISDDKWRWSKDALVYNSIRGGETWDAKEVQKGWKETEFDPEEDWKQVAVVDGPGGELRSQYMPPMRVTQRIKPVKIFEPEEELYVADFGENLTGFAEITIPPCEEGTVIRLFYNEVLNPDSTLNKTYSAGHTRGRFQQGRYICGSSEPDTISGHFTYHGFRYIQVEGYPGELSAEDIIAFAVHTDLEPAGTFRSSDKRLNQLQSAIRRTLLNSVHSMPGEEPTREKMGWTLDAGLNTMESYLFNFHAISTYKKYLQDLIDSQEPSGHIPAIVPTNGWSFVDPATDEPVLYDDPWWGGTIFFVTDRLFAWTADTAIIKHSYQPMVDYLDFVGSTADDSLIVHWSLGDWLDPEHNEKGWGPGLTPISLTSTAYYYYMAKELERIAGILNREEDEQRFSLLAAEVRERFNERFLDEETGWYSENSQPAQAIPLWMGLPPDKDLSNVHSRLLDAVDAYDGHIATGFLGVKPILEWLSEKGHFERAFTMVRNEDSPGWLHMVEDEFSTVGENLNARGYGTGHHPFGTGVGHWLYRYLGGVRNDSTAGWKSFIFEPQWVEGLEWVAVEYDSPYGGIKATTRNKDSRTAEVTFPANTLTTIIVRGVDKADVLINGEELDQCPWVREITTTSDRLQFVIANGRYNIELINTSIEE